MLPTSKRCWDCVLKYRELIAPRVEAHYKWGGDEASKPGQRNRVQRIYGLEGCEHPGCEAKAIDRHHVDGNPGNNKPGNIMGLCRRHHMEIDGRLDALREMASAPRQIKPPQPCRICSKPYKPLRKGRCAACNQYRIRNGRDKGFDA